MDHQEARQLIHRAEWALSIVSAVTLLFSVWVSIILPRQVIQPLVSLKEAVDHAATGNYEIEFELHGGGEVVELAKSVQNLTSFLRGQPYDRGELEARQRQKEEKVHHERQEKST
jgi:nitrogen fixation/metabolism regulation signal transduction histidine kinase